MMNTTRRFWLSSGGALLLAGCGFTLSRPTSYAFRSIHIAGSSLMGLGPEMQRLLLAGGTVEVITDPRQIERADLVLEILQELREKVVVGRTSTGAVRENQLRLRVRFRVRNREGIERIPETELVQVRDITFNESYVLAKTSEETLLYANMQTDMIQQILRRLAALQQI
jgi:LPS-assembly lipoprotein